MTIITLAALRELAVAALTGQTDAGQNVFSPRTKQTQDYQYPMIMVRTPKEDKTSIGRGTPQFTVIGTLRVTARASDVSEGAVELQIEALKAQIEVALINNPTLMQNLQQVASVSSEHAVKAEGDFYLADLMIDFGLEFYQGAEAFYPIAGVPLTEIKLYADLGNVFDPSGTYAPGSQDASPPNPPFPAPHPAPRTSGPDGRFEGVLDITLPQS